MANDNNLKLRRGDSKTYLLHFRNDAGADIDITGWTIFFTASDNPSPTSDTTAQIKKTITSHIDASHGQTQIVLTSTDTALLGDYFYDIQVKKLDGFIETPLSGMISFEADQTIRTS